MSSYYEVLDTIQALPELCYENRCRRGLSLREAAKELGCSVATLHRFEKGDRGSNLSLTVRILRWLAKQ